MGKPRGVGARLYAARAGANLAGGMMRVEAKNSAGKGARRGWIPYFVLAVSLAMTVAAAWYVSVSSRETDWLRLHSAARRTCDAIESRLDTYVALVRGGSGLFAARVDVTGDDFARYAERLQLRKKYAALQGIGYARWIQPGR